MKDKMLSYRQLSQAQKEIANTLPVRPGTGLDDEIFMVIDDQLRFLETQPRDGRYAGDWGWYCRICHQAFRDGTKHESCNGQYIYAVRTEEIGRRLESLHSLQELWDLERG